MALKTYYQLTKPGVLYGNVLTGVAGFLLGAAHFRRFDFVLFAATIGGMTLVIASACALNNVLDRDIDRIMARTKGRGVASGDVSVKAGLALASILGLLGLVVLIVGSTTKVVLIGLVGYVVYVWLYGAFSKRRSVHGTLVGSVSGAMPILAGYVAVSDRYDMAALLVFLQLFFWQFPEFYSIAIYRRNEYAAAGIPLMSVVYGVRATVWQIAVYTVLFVAACLALTPLGFTGWLYLLSMGLLGAYWIKLAVQGLMTQQPEAWARKMFHVSLIALLALCVALPLGALLP